MCEIFETMVTGQGHLSQIFYDHDYIEGSVLTFLLWSTYWYCMLKTIENIRICTGRTEAGLFLSILILVNHGGAPISAILVRKYGHTFVAALG